MGLGWGERVGHDGVDENGAARAAGIAAVVNEDDGLWGWGWGDMMSKWVWLSKQNARLSLSYLRRATATRAGSHSPGLPSRCSTRCWPGSIFALPLPTRRGRRT